MTSQTIESMRDMDAVLAALEDSEDQLIELWREIGSRNLLHVLDILGGPLGMQTYVPSPANFLAGHRRTTRDRDIRHRFKHGSNAHELAVEYGVSESRIRQITRAQPRHTAAENRA